MSKGKSFHQLGTTKENRLNWDRRPHKKRILGLSFADERVCRNVAYYCVDIIIYSPISNHQGFKLDARAEPVEGGLTWLNFGWLKMRQAAAF